MKLAFKPVKQNQGSYKTFVKDGLSCTKTLKDSIFMKN